MKVDYNVPLAEMLGLRAVRKAEGYRPISLCLHEQAVVPHFTVVWVQRAGPGWEMLLLATQEEVDEYLGKSAPFSPRWPRLIGAVRSSKGYGKPRYALVVENSFKGPASRVEFDAYQGELQNHVDQAHAGGQEYLRSIAAYGRNQFDGDFEIKFAAVWETQPPSFAQRGRGRHLWNCIFADAFRADRIHDALRAGFAEPELCTVGGGPAGLRYAMLFRDDVISGTELRRDVPVAELEDLIREKAEHRHGPYHRKWPIRIHGTAVDEGQRFSVIFATLGEYLPKSRSFHVDRRVASTIGSSGWGPGQQSTADLGLQFSAFDGYMKALMQDNSVRVGQIAIAWQGRLVYTAAYTWAEGGYPQATVDTRMRVGSISKVITATAILRLLEDQPGVFPKALDTPFMDILGPKLPAGATWDPDLGTRTLDHLLGHLGRFKLDDDLAATFDLPAKVFPAVGAQFFPGLSSTEQVVAARLNFNTSHFAWYALTQSTTSLLAEKKPGAVQHVLLPGGGMTVLLPMADYSNLGYFLLGEVLQALVGKQEPWIFLNVLGKDHTSKATMTVQKSAVAEADAAEVRYHPRVPSWGSELYGDDPAALAPLQYDALHVPTLLPSGGWALPAYECAWLFTRINPAAGGLFDQQTTELAARAKIAANKLRTVWEYVDGRHTYYQHNGDLQGTSALAFTRSDGLTIAIAFNTDILGGLHIAKHGRSLAGKATSIPSWPAGNLFPGLLP